MRDTNGLRHASAGTPSGGQFRVAKGVPTGGRFAAKGYTEADHLSNAEFLAELHRERRRARVVKLMKIGAAVVGTAAIAAVAVSIIAGAAVSSGTVTGKDYEEARTYTTTSCSHIGKITSCSPRVQTDDEDYVLTVNDGENSGRIEVTQEQYNQIDVGDWYGSPAP